MCILYNIRLLIIIILLLLYSPFPSFYDTNMGVTYVSFRSRGQEYKYYTPEISLCFPIMVV